MSDREELLDAKTQGLGLMQFDPNYFDFGDRRVKIEGEPRQFLVH